MENLIPVEGTTFVRDPKNMALINRDSGGREEYSLKKRMLVDHKNEINNVKQDMVELKEDLYELKTMMLKLIEKNING
jgi:hypothetical protein